MIIGTSAFLIPDIANRSQLMEYNTIFLLICKYGKDMRSQFTYLRAIKDNKIDVNDRQLIKSSGLQGILPRFN